MSLLTVTHLAKSFGERELFANVDFRADKGDRIGLVGTNGTGKTTLFNCLTGKLQHDDGAITFADNISVGYVEQQHDFAEHTLWDEFLAAFADVIALDEKTRAMEKTLHTADEKTLARYANALNQLENDGGYDYESRIRRVAFGLGFDEGDFAKKAAHFSGGQKTRILLAKALMREPDLLLLDEPTNHLDIKMIEWLEDFLTNYRGAFLIISHDRYFLDRVTNRILELAGGTVNSYVGNYSCFIKIRDERMTSLTAAYAKQQEYIKRTEEYIRRYKAGIKAKQARGRESKLKRLERIVLPPPDEAFSFFALNRPADCAERVVEAKNIAVTLGGRELFSGVNILIKKGDGVALIGANGTGKTTLLKIIVGELTAFSGDVKIGNRVKIGYFSQQHEGLDKSNTVLREIAYNYGLNEENARTLLGSFLFKGDDVYRVIGELSGGEQSRLAFLKLMLTGANFLVLDEPTNHLDIPSKEAVETALMSFDGTFLVVSHDRYFLERTTNRTLELEGGKITEYNGSYEYYRQKKAELAEIARSNETTAHKNKSGNTTKKTVQNPQPTAKATADKEKFAKVADNLSAEKREELLSRTEAQIAMAEAELKGLEFEMNKAENQADPQKSEEIARLYAEKETELAVFYQRWENIIGD